MYATTCRLALPLVVLFAATVGSAKDPRGRSEILRRVESLIGDEAGEWCREAGLDYPPKVVLFRAFKKELELEIWAANKPRDKLRLVRTIPVCAIVEEAGPKLKPYDKRTPEGFYHLAPRFRSRLPWMWTKLESGKVEDFGVVGDGSPFFYHLDYPNLVDAAHSKAAGYRVPRGEICVHPNCATEGCVSFENRDFLFVFAFASHHRAAKLGKVQLHIFPFRFDHDWEFADEAASYRHLNRLGRKRLREFWQNLREGFELFNRTHQPLQFGFGASSARDKGSKGAGMTRYRFVEPDSD